jgi:GMP synthase (glutamine-hydrolysing)
VAKGEYTDLKVYVVDNGGQWTHREWRVLRYLGVDTKIIPNDTPWPAIAAEGLHGIILSGGAPRVGVEGTLGRCDEILDNADFPVLGICAGHQFIARHYGGDAAPGEGEFGATELEVIPHETPDLLAGVPERSQVWESHHDEVNELPPGFQALARSDRCAVQAMRDSDRRIFGVQFHPEVEHSEHGLRIFQNFLDVCRARQSARVPDAA